MITADQSLTDNQNGDNVSLSSDDDFTLDACTESDSFLNHRFHPVKKEEDYYGYRSVFNPRGEDFPLIV